LRARRSGRGRHALAGTGRLAGGKSAITTVGSGEDATQLMKGL